MTVCDGFAALEAGTVAAVVEVDYVVASWFAADTQCVVAAIERLLLATFSISLLPLDFPVVEW